MTSKKKWILNILMLWFVVASTVAQADVDYAHRVLKKEVEKCWSQDISALKEIDIHSRFPLQGKFFILSGSNNKYVYVGRVNSCRAGGCSIGNESYGASEYFDYFIFFDALANVELVKIYNYAATHGHEVMARGWLKQFQGYNNGSELEVGKNVDAISGATISADAITQDIQEKTNLMEGYLHVNISSNQ